MTVPLLIPINPLVKVPCFERPGVYWHRKSGLYVLTKGLSIDLHNPEIPYYRNDLKGFAIRSGRLELYPGFASDGATLALDEHSLLGAFVHDCLCWAADDGHQHSGAWRQTYFCDICRAQGMGVIHAGFRWTMLQTFGRIYQAL